MVSVCGFSTECAETRTEVVTRLWPMTNDTDNPVSQSKLRANMCSRQEARENVRERHEARENVCERQEARENVCERVTIGFGFTCDWIRERREFFRPINKRSF